MMQNILYSAWHMTSELRDSITMKRINLQQLNQEMKLKSILRGQVKPILFPLPFHYMFTIDVVLAWCLIVHDLLYL